MHSGCPHMQTSPPLPSAQCSLQKPPSSVVQVHGPCGDCLKFGVSAVWPDMLDRSGSAERTGDERFIGAGDGTVVGGQAAG